MQPVLGKRTRDESQAEEAGMGSAIKRMNITGQATTQRLNPDQVDVERNIFGEIVGLQASDPNGARNFSVSSLTEPGATDVVFHPREREGWNTVADVT